ncbi:MAG: ABC transporter permease, partial [Bacteroidota bacterium]
KIALRNVSYSSVINIIGLSAGLAVSVYLIIYINQQLSFDNFHSKSSRIYRVLNNMNHSTGTLYLKEISTRHALGIDKSLPFVERSTNVSSELKVVVKLDGESFYEPQLHRADSNFFRVFDFDLFEGNEETVLKSLDKIVVSSRIADKYFGDTSPLGEVITISNKVYEIEGVLKPAGRSSHLNIDFLGVNDYADPKGDLWLTKYFLSANENEYDMERQVNQLFNGEVDKAYKFSIQRLIDIHLHTNPELNDFSVNGNIDFLYVLGSVALLILITVSFNHTNLTLAKYLKRIKEMGIRKIQGASRKQIILQLLLETFTIVSVAILLGGVFLEFALPHMNHWIQYEVMLDYTSPQLYSIFASVLVVVTLAAGLYPAYYITSFSPSSLLRSDSIKPTSRVGLIKILVGIQFVISTMLLTATVIMQKQMDYLNEKDLGLLAEGVLAINANSKINQLQYESFKKDLLDLPEVKKVAAGPMPDRSFSTPVKNRYGESFDINITYVLDDYVDLLDIEIINGRNFDFENLTDMTQRVIINEEALKLLGLPNGGVGEYFSFQELDLSTFMSGERRVEVIGIVKDFHYRSLRDKIAPLFLVVSETKGLRKQIGIRYSSRDTQALLNKISTLWKALDTDSPFSYAFLTDEYDKFNSSDNRLASGFAYIFYLAILLSALGLFSLSNLEAKGNFKTISIKKVLGASTLLLLRQHLGSYFMMSLGAGLVGLSIAWWLIQEWLQHFTYRFEVNVLTVVLPVVMIIFVAASSVFYNLQSAASVNPIENLRKE